MQYVIEQISLFNLNDRPIAGFIDVWVSLDVHPVVDSLLVHDDLVFFLKG